MPFIVPFIPLITGGLAAGTSIYGAHSAAKSNEKAINAQSAANQQALQFEKQKYADLNTRLSPYRQAGAGATMRMSDLLGVSGGGRPMASLLGPAPGEPQAGDPGYPVTGFSKAPGTEWLKAPDGTTRAVPTHLVDRYLARGAVRV